MDIQLIIQISVVAVVVIAFIIWLVWQIKKNGLREFVIDMIVEAEETFHDGQNKEKMKYVIGELKDFLSVSLIGKLISFFLTEENIEKFIQGVFDSIKIALDYVPIKEE